MTRLRARLFLSVLFSICLTGGALLAQSGAAQADDEPVFSVQGFGTLGAARTTTKDVRFVRDLTQPTGASNRWDGRVDSLLGLQANWRLSPELEVVAQGVSRFRYDQTYTPEFSWVFLKYDPNPRVSMRVGRLGTEFFMMADSRMVGYSYLPVRPPGDFFWYLPFLGIDGADLAMIFPLGEDVLRGKLYYGVSDASIPLADKQWKIDGSRMAGGYLDYQSGAWLFRVSYANIRFSNDMPIDDVLGSYLPVSAQAPARDFLAAANTRSHYYSIGAVYDRGPWQIQLMLNSITQGARIFESSKGGYVLAGYRVGSVTPYVGYSRVFSDSRGTTLNPVVARIMADAHVDQYTTILGARWDLARNIAVKAQWDGIHGKADSIFPFRLESDAFKGRLDVFSLTMDFVF